MNTESVRLWMTALGWGALCLATPVSADLGGEWVDLASMQQPRQETGAARIDDRVYVVGGLIGFGFARDTVEAYDLATGTWSFISPLPEPRDHMGAAALDGKLYVSGGFAGSFDAREELFVYDPATDSWSEAAPMPEPRGGHWMVAHGGRLYVFGGVDAAGRVRVATLIYDPGTDTWSLGADLPTRREHLNAVSAGDFIYVLGGRTGPPSNAHERYHPATDTWTSLAPLPTARSAGAVAALNGRIHYMGGEIPRLFAVHEVYDIATDTWDCAAPMPLPRHGVAAVALEDRILVPAGGTVQGLAPTVRMDAFVPDAGTPGTLSLTAESFVALEGASAGAGSVELQVQVQVRRTGGTVGGVAVDYALEDLSATAGEDYLPASGTLQWADGEGGAKSFPVPVVDDADPERTELARVVLTDPTGSATLERRTAVVAIRDDDGAPGCIEGAEALCLVDGRFRVEAEWRDPRSGDSGLARTILESGTTGFFWFFSPTNVELIVKMLDGRSITGAFWVFYGALSDVEYWISVTDTEGGTGGKPGGEPGEQPAEFRIFHNEPFVLASFADTSAFPAPPAAPESSSLSARLSAAPAGHGERSHEEQSHGGQSHEEQRPAPQPGSTAPCQVDVETLCLGPGGRFRVTVTWAEPGGDSGTGRAEVRSEETGTFWFFTPDNLELVVKVLDARTVNGHFWFFSGALSNVEYTIVVTDTATGATREYPNPQGTLQSRADTEAFDG